MDEVKIAKFGSKAEVYNGLAKMTRGKLTKDHLLINAKGKVVSKKAQERGFNLQKQLQGRMTSSASPVSSIVKEIVEDLPKAKDLTVEKVRKPRVKKDSIPQNVES